MALDSLMRQARLVEENWRAAWASLALVPEAPRTFADASDDVLRVYTPGLPETLVNMVIGYHAPGPVRLTDITGTLEPYYQHRLPPQWWLLMGDEPDGLRARMTEAGMQSWGGVPAMYLPLDGWQPRYPSVAPSVSLGPVRNEDDARAAVRVISSVFYVPESQMMRWTIRNSAFRVYLARVGVRAASALATFRAGTVVGVYHVATERWAQRQGIAGNLLIAALAEARAEGATEATLTATPEAEHLYTSLGFRSVGAIEQWMAGPRLMADLMFGHPQG